MITSASLQEVRDKACLEISGAGSLENLEGLRVRLLGKKGELTLMMKELGGLDPTARRELGMALNAAKEAVEEQLEKKRGELNRAAAEVRLGGERIDVTLPARAAIAARAPGSTHPLTKVQRELERIFLSLGFSVLDGPEVEREYYNFDALNIPETHPARDMQDTIWNKNGTLLRTHTSAMQVRVLEHFKPPVRAVFPGRCFRYERIDATHEHTFYQMEGMMVDKEVTVGHLIYFMKTLLREVLGFEPQIRLRPGFFPFVEPGFELDIWFKDRWLELLPCGLIHPRVLEFGGLDPKEWQGFAFGLGLSRLVMSRYVIDDIRHLQGCDLRFLKQFG